MDSLSFRAYILLVGRDTRGRALRMIPGTRDHYERLSNADLVAAETAIEGVRAQVTGALADITAEKYDRLEHLE